MALAGANVVAVEAAASAESRADGPARVATLATEEGRRPLEELALSHLEALRVVYGRVHGKTIFSDAPMCCSRFVRYTTARAAPDLDSLYRVHSQSRP